MTKFRSAECRPTTRKRAQRRFLLDERGTLGSLALCYLEDDDSGRLMLLNLDAYFSQKSHQATHWKRRHEVVAARYLFGEPRRIVIQRVVTKLS
jgi:hypothetical protein